MLRKRAFVPLAFFLYAGCAGTSDVSDAHYFGYTSFEGISSEADGVAGKSLETIGLRIGPGVGLGYFKETRIWASPDCRLVMLVPNERALARVLETLEQFNGGELCAAVTVLSSH